MTLDRLYAWYWGLWLVLLFGVPEAFALMSGHPERTLSAWVWRLEGTGPTVGRYFIAAFLLWLLLHMVWRLFR